MKDLGCLVVIWCVGVLLLLLMIDNHLEAILTQLQAVVRK